MVGKLALDDHTKAAKLKQNIGAVLSMNMYCLAVGSHAVPGDKNSKLRVDSFFTITMPCHALLLSLTFVE
jgi:hypothetical protein